MVGRRSTLFIETISNKQFNDKQEPEGSSNNSERRLFVQVVLKYLNQKVGEILINGTDRTWGVTAVSEDDKRLLKVYLKRKNEVYTYTRVSENL